MKRTPLFETHRAAGARLVDFAGWEMPVQYAGVKAEHKAVREAAGIFDVSHMGEFTVTGDAAEPLVNHVITNDIRRAEPGQAQYTVMCKPDGGIVDDLIVYKTSERELLLVVNASNIDKDFQWITSMTKDFDAEVTNISDAKALLAVQGPRATPILSRVTEELDASAVKRFRFALGKIAGHPVTFARTGYTGEDGFELMTDAADAAAVWQAVVEAGDADGLVPCGLGARDTLRLEMAYPLYGNDIDETTNPIEAGLGWVVKLDKENFVGKEAIAAVKASGPERKRVGFEMTERGIARHGYPLLDEKGNKIGDVTSGTMSPSLDKAIGVGYVPASFAAPGTPLAVEIRGAGRSAVITETPFYKP